MSDNITDLQAVRDRRRIYAEMDEEAALWNEICGRLRKIMAEMVELALPDDALTLAVLHPLLEVLQYGDVSRRDAKEMIAKILATIGD
jgi:hypothetical protein